MTYRERVLGSETITEKKKTKERQLLNAWLTEEREEEKEEPCNEMKEY